MTELLDPKNYWNPSLTADQKHYQVAGGPAMNLLVSNTFDPINGTVPTTANTMTMTGPAPLPGVTGANTSRNVTFVSSTGGLTSSTGSTAIDIAYPLAAGIIMHRVLIPAETFTGTSLFSKSVFFAINTSTSIIGFNPFPFFIGNNIIGEVFIGTTNSLNFFQGISGQSPTFPSCPIELLYICTS